MAYKEGFKFCICPSALYTMYTDNLSTNQNYKTQNKWKSSYEPMQNKKEHLKANHKLIMLGLR